MTVNDYWDMKQSTIQPTCRVEPESAQDVSTIIKTLTDSMCHFAIKGGGHGREAYISSTDGVLIDLVRLSEVKISKDRKRFDSTPSQLKCKSANIRKCIRGRRKQMAKSVQGPRS